MQMIHIIPYKLIKQAISPASKTYDRYNHSEISYDYVSCHNKSKTFAIIVLGILVVAEHIFDTHYLKKRITTLIIANESLLLFCSI
jgi:hypothetical protein